MIVSVPIFYDQATTQQVGIPCLSRGWIKKFYHHSKELVEIDYSRVFCNLKNPIKSFAAAI